MTKMNRYVVIDCIRGCAILAMMAYHFGFDLNMQGYIAQDLNHSMVWQIARSLILSTFLFVAGFSIALATQQSLKKRLIRLVRIAFCAVLVSVVSLFMFPDSWIFFGVLHFVVVASVICWVVMPYKKLLMVLTVAITVIGTLFSRQCLMSQHCSG